jgi:hypothetical protein
MRIGDVRRAQIVTTYGVGALVAFDDKSYMIAGLDYWTVGEPDLMEPRLARRLRVSGFILPPAEQEKKDVPVIRFPLWHSCADCNLLQEHKSLLEEIRCRACDGRLVPSRFVICCPKGHIDDFPYFRWVHAGKEKTEAKHGLYIETSGASASLQGLLVKCICGAGRTMHGAFAKNAIGKCSGQRPWIGGDAEDCSEIARTLQRGASNVWFSHVESSLSIPPWSDAVFTVLDRHWTVLKTLRNREILKNTLSQMKSVLASGFDLDEIVDVALQRQAGESAEDDDRDLKLEEYRALCHGYPQTHQGDEFVCLPAKELTKFIVGVFQRVMLVTRLREVRALRSFTRLLPFAPGAAYKDFPPLSQEPLDWLPAIEVNGEGVFFEFELKRLAQWENRADVKERASSIHFHYLDMLRQSQVISSLVVTPRLLLLHTFAHAIINQWSLECGYPAASLRERLYVSDEMAGVLIYTATGDSAGSLGGVIGQAKADRLEPGIREGIYRASWCSGDPVCIEAEAQGTNSLNRAACHACVLLPEVSCEFGNVFLDRGMLTGWPEHTSAGFFSDVAD